MPASVAHGITHQPPPPPVEHEWGGGGEGRGSSRRASFAGLFLMSAASAMVFAAFTAAFIARRGLSDDWAGIPKPPILWVNTAILLLSSLALEAGRRALKTGARARFTAFWTAATALGVLFLLGQTAAWMQLRSAGIYVATSAGSSFFYVLTAAHAAHLLPAVAALAWVDVQALRLRLGPARRTAIDITALFWHFLDSIWILLMVLFYVWA
jgi:cytochrome c oxidase subunit 3